VGTVTARKLHERGLLTVGQVARLPEALLVAVLGRAAGRHLHALAHNRDPRPVQPGRRRGSIGSQRALGRGRRTAAELDAVLLGLVDRVTGRLRRARRLGRTVVLRLRFDDFSRATRSLTLPGPTQQTAAVAAAARGLLAAALPEIERRGVTLVGIAVANLESEVGAQLVLPLDGGGREALDAALDAIRDRYGTSAVTRAVLLGRDPGLTMPLLPD
jgi:DNA polymerase-4